jgi:hypothetical protein
MSILAALFATGLWKWLLGALGALAVGVLGWQRGKSAGAAQASGQAESKVQAAQAAQRQAENTAATAQAAQEEAQAHLDAKQQAVDVKQQVDQMTDEEVKKDVGSNWSR